MLWRSIRWVAEVALIAFLGTLAAFLTIPLLIIGVVVSALVILGVEARSLLPKSRREVIRVTCLNERCEYYKRVNEYDENYRQHSEWRCGNCGELLTEIPEVAGGLWLQARKLINRGLIRSDNDLTIISEDVDNNCRIIRGHNESGEQIAVKG